PHPFYLSLIPPPPRPTLFPYTTLFRSHHRHLSGIEPSCGAKAEHHAGLRLRTEAAVIAGDEIEMVGDAETLRGPPDRQFVVAGGDRKSTRLNSSHVKISYAVFCLKKKK